MSVLQKTLMVRPPTPHLSVQYLCGCLRKVPGFSVLGSVCRARLRLLSPSPSPFHPIRDKWPIPLRSRPPRDLVVRQVHPAPFASLVLCPTAKDHTGPHTDQPGQQTNLVWSTNKSYLFFVFLKGLVNKYTNLIHKQISLVNKQTNLVWFTDRSTSQKQINLA